MEPQNRRSITLARDWAKRFPADAGVYAMFHADNLIYIGETGRISARMTDLLDSRNHVLRRSIGNEMFAGEPEFIKATARRRFTDELEDRLREFIVRNIRVSAVVVPFGRAEIEEYMTGKYRPKYNNKGKRGVSLR
jgi:hypothetical protein